jgi:nicotinate-nucleotide adenylyltransferase
VKIGIVGGSFDPPHFGHLNLAEEAKRRLGLDRVYFVPAGQPPHKSPEDLSPPLLRYQMTRLAVRNRPGLEVSDVEIRRPPPSYSVDTIKAFRHEFPYPHEIFFIVGADSLKIIRSWKDLNLILEMCRFVAASRPGYSLSFPSEIKKIQIDDLDISSSEIRKKIKADQDVSECVPYKVLRLIEKEGLYR